MRGSAHSPHTPSELQTPQPVIPLQSVKVNVQVHFEHVSRRALFSFPQKWVQVAWQLLQKYIHIGCTERGLFQTEAVLSVSVRIIDRNSRSFGLPLKVRELDGLDYPQCLGSHVYKIKLKSYFFTFQSDYIVLEVLYIDPLYTANNAKI